VFFCTQLPTDVPDEVLSQLGARVQHALRAFTPKDQQALAKTVKTYPTTPHYNLAEALTSLGIGEAIVTVLSERGAPTPVAWSRLRAPRSLMAAIGPDAVTTAATTSRRHVKYGQTVDRESAYEQLTAKIAAGPTRSPGLPAQEHQQPKEPALFEKVLTARWCGRSYAQPPPRSGARSPAGCSAPAAGADPRPFLGVLLGDWIRNEHGGPVGPRLGPQQRSALAGEPGSTDEELRDCLKLRGIEAGDQRSRVALQPGEDLG
jgi:hypothetical protein